MTKRNFIECLVATENKLSIDDSERPKKISESLKKRLIRIREEYRK